jgi:hypothetical protein
MDIPEQLKVLTVQLDDIEQLFKNDRMEQAKEATKGSQGNQITLSSFIAAHLISRTLVNEISI